MSLTLEVCVDSLESAVAAEQGGADRIELCSSLGEGGITPSHGLLQQVCRTLNNCRVHVLIRPRGGDFLYSESEVAAIKEDILHATSLGAHGVVLGFLTPQGTVDVNLTGYFVELCSALGLDLTFHRAFDVVKDQHAALNALIGCRVRRVLTSGGHSVAYKGIEQLSSLVSEASGRISIMPGGGLTEENAVTLLQVTGAREIHGTFRRSVPSNMTYIHPTVTFSAPQGDAAQGNNVNGEVRDPRGAWERCIADADVIRRVKSQLAELAEEEEGMG